MGRLWARRRVSICRKNGRIGWKSNETQLIKRSTGKNTRPRILPQLNRFLRGRRVLRQCLVRVRRVGGVYIADDRVVREVPTHGWVVHERGDAELRKESAVADP